MANRRGEEDDKKRCWDDLRRVVGQLGEREWDATNDGERGRADVVEKGRGGWRGERGL